MSIAPNYTGKIPRHLSKENKPPTGRNQTMSKELSLKDLFEDAEQFERYQDPKQVARNKARLARLAKKIKESC